MMFLQSFHQGCSALLTINSDFKTCLLLFRPSRMITSRLLPVAMAVALNWSWWSPASFFNTRAKRHEPVLRTDTGFQLGNASVVGRDIEGVGVLPGSKLGRDHRGRFTSLAHSACLIPYLVYNACPSSL